MHINKKSSGGKTLKSFFFLLFLVVASCSVYAWLVFFENEKPIATINNSQSFLGKNGSISLTAEDRKTGIRSIKLSIMQNNKEHVLFEKMYSRGGYYGHIGPENEHVDVIFEAQKAGFADGTAEIVAEVRDFSLRGYLSGNLTKTHMTVTIDTVPPKVRLVHAERYISPGGSGIVIYQIPEHASDHGVNFNGYFHKGFPVDKGPENTFISYIALPYDALTITESNISASDEAGNITIVSFAPVFKSGVQKLDKIIVSDNFLKKKIPEFEQHYPEMQGTMEEQYLYTNQILRKENNQAIADLCSNPTTKRLWSGKFKRMAGASRAGFADHRTYYYNGKEIDKQVHLGMDIASIKRAEVKAANKGVVIHAGYLGIYGNMVMLDHGQGVFSLYSHLSQIQVAVGDMIEENVVLGLTGTSGMAGGDHLHFSMLINGIFVTPKEWWDQQWIDVTIENPLINARF